MEYNDQGENIDDIDYGSEDDVSDDEKEKSLREQME
jgi:hypothetical protein